MTQNSISITPAKPVSPLNYSAAKGELRLVDDVLMRWDGRDWQVAVIPSDQLDTTDENSTVQLTHALHVSGTGTTPNDNDALWVTGNQHTTGNVTTDGYYYGTDIRISTHSGGTEYLANIEDTVNNHRPRGFEYESKQTTNGGTGAGESYAGVGITWFYDASRRLKIISKVIILAISSSGGAWESRAILRGAPGSGVSTSDPRMDLSPITCFAGARNAHLMITDIPPGTWTDGIQVYVALFVDCFGPATYSFQRLSDPGFPTYVIKEDWGD